MPSPIAHSVSGYVFSRLPIIRNLVPQQHLFAKPLTTLYAVFVSNLPDLDFIPQILTGLRFHRGPSHSLLAAALVSSFLAFIISRTHRQVSYVKVLGFLASLYSLHLFMDMFTAGGNGLPLLWPLSEQFFRAPFALFPPVHHSRGLWDSSHLIFIAVELSYSLIIFSGLKLIKNRVSKEAQL